MSESNGRQDDGRDGKPQFEFRGGYLFAGVWYLLRDGKLTKTELLLGTLIDAMVKCGGDGCFASNKYLADAVGSTVTHVSESLHRMEGLGLLTIKWKGHKRFLEMQWSRAGETSTLRKNPKPPSEKSEATLRKNPKHKEYSTETNTSTTPPGLATPSRDGDCDGFGLEQQPKSPYHALAATLHQTMLRLKVLPKRDRDLTVNRLGAWAKELRDGLAYLEVEVEDANAVVEWWGKHHNDQYTPQAESVGGWLKKYPKIVAAMSRNGHSNGKSPQPVQLTADEQAVVTKLRDLDWPGGGRDLLPKVVHDSFVGYGHFIANLVRIANDQSIHKSHRRLADRILDQYQRPAPEFITRWVRAVNEHYHDTWAGWQGHVEHFHARNKRLTSECRDVANSYTNNPDRWDELLSLFKE